MFGNLALLLAGRAVRGGSSAALARTVSVLLGGIGVIGFVLFLNGRFLGLGPGGMERVWAYGFLAWVFVAGWVIILRRGLPGRG